MTLYGHERTYLFVLNSFEEADKNVIALKSYAKPNEDEKWRRSKKWTTNTNIQFSGKTHTRNKRVLLFL